MGTRMARAKARFEWPGIALGWVTGLVLLPILTAACLCARYCRKPFDVGLGPQPLINNIYHKKALLRFGYSALTFVTKSYYITSEFDRNFRIGGLSRVLPGATGLAWSSLRAFLHSIFNYRIVYFYFNGGPLALFRAPLRRLEPALYHLAGVKIVVMPYGTDVQDMTRSPNLIFKHAQSLSYPNLRLTRRLTQSKIDLWTEHADHVLSGVEWVDYMAHWDTLMLGHFSIDTAKVQSSPAGLPYTRGQGPLKIVHAPNHRNIKGTQTLIDAVKELNAEGTPVELELIEKRPNAEVLASIERAHVVADQLIVGWYAMFAIEAMAMCKPVICYIRPDLEDFYRKTGLLGRDELPFLNADTLTIKTMIRDISEQKYDLEKIGLKARAFVVRHHSLEAIGATFDSINRSLGVAPSIQIEATPRAVSLRGDA
jgi:hypothetical protein